MMYTYLYIFQVSSFDLVVESGGGRRVGAVDTLTALVTGRWMISTNQMMSMRMAAQ